MKKIIISIILFLFFIPNVKTLELSSEHIVLYNLNEDKIIYQKSSDEVTSIASLTKIMTTLVAIENIENYNEKVTLNYNMFKGLAEANASVIGLKNGQKVTCNDLLYGMFLASGADATRAIAISVAGSEKNFVNLMNKKAKELSMNNTNFKNTTGLDEIGHYSTVNDVAIMLKEALKNEKFKEIFTSDYYIFTDRSLTVYSTLRQTANKYGYDVNYIEGAKTGYTYGAGKALASIAYDKENNIRYLLVTTNASIDKSDAYHLKDAVTIYNYYFENYKYHNVVNKDDLILTLPTKYVKNENIKIYAKDDIKFYTSNIFNKDNVKLKYSGIDLVTPKIKKGTKLGKLQIIYNNEIINNIDIYLEEELKFSLLVFLKENMNYIILSIAALSILILILIIYRKRSI